MPRSKRSIIEEGVRVADSLVLGQDKIWSKYSNDKIDIGQTLAAVTRTLARALPLGRPLRALSIGSSNEPQFRLLQTSYGGGLYLMDIDKPALDAVRERIRRQDTRNVTVFQRDYTRIFHDEAGAARFLRGALGGRRLELVTLQHSMYYCPESAWIPLVRGLWRTLVASQGAFYAVLMSARSDDPRTTTWLYNHFAGRFCGHRNDQDLLKLARSLACLPDFRRARIRTKTTEVRFFVDDFRQFMAVVWMILLYPQVHDYTLEQRHEITEFVYRAFFEKRRHLLQRQDHLVSYRGIGFRGLI